MSYVDVNAPLPRNSMSPVPACEIAAAHAQVQAVEQMAANGKATIAQIATPESFSGMGRGVTRDVQRSQRELIAAKRFALTRPRDTRPSDALRFAPTVLPLNVTTEEYGCSIRGVGPVRPMQISMDQQQVLMPPPAPTDTSLLFPENTGLAPARTFGHPRPRIPKMYTGMAGVPWGDAIQDPRARMAQSGFSGKGLLLLALGGLGLYAVTRKGKR